MFRSALNLYITTLTMTTTANTTFCNEEAENIFAVKNVSEPIIR